MGTSTPFPPTDEDYLLLGLSPHGRQSPAVVKATFRALSKELHPDTGGDPAHFAAVRSAYERVLAACGTPRAEWVPPSTSEAAAASRADAPATTRVEDPPPAAERPTPAAEQDRLWRRCAVTAGRVLFLSRRWPESELGVFVGLVASAGAALLIHAGTPAGLPQALAEIAPGFLVAGRAMTVRARLLR